MRQRRSRNTTSTKKVDDGYDDVRDWGFTEERIEKLRKEDEARRSDPVRNQRLKNVQRLSSLVTDMTWPYFHDNTPDSIEANEISYKKCPALYTALRRLAPFLIDTPAVSQDRSQWLDNDESSHSRAIDLACDRARWAFNVGASLYLLQQMHDRGLVQTPSLGKAQWLLSTAPLSRDEPSRHKKNKIDPDQIGKRWKDYYPVSHCWAAFVVWSGTPLIFDREYLFRFLSTANPDDFDRLVEFFLDFRQRVEVPFFSNKGKQETPFIKKEVGHRVIDTASLTPDSVPNLLSDYQWDALASYRAPVRKNTPRK